MVQMLPSLSARKPCATLNSPEPNPPLYLPSLSKASNGGSPAMQHVDVAFAVDLHGGHRPEFHLRRNL